MIKKYFKIVYKKFWWSWQLGSQFLVWERRPLKINYKFSSRSQNSTVPFVF